jgi:phenylacetate-CoA ligase
VSAWALPLFLGMNRLIGSHCGARLRELHAWAALSDDELHARRAARLDEILRFAAAHVPFYRTRVGSANAPLNAFPILTREDLRQRFTDLMSPDLRAEHDGAARRARYGWLVVRTGGSTGTPTAVIHDADFRDSDRAARLYAQELCGFPFGTPYFRLWGSMRDIDRSRDAWTHRAMTRLAGERILNAFRMDLDRMAPYLELLNASPVRHMMAYVDAAAELARFARRRGIAVRPLASVMACAGTLTDDRRAAIRETLSPRVQGKYGSRDCGDMACECEAGGCHVFANRCVFEVVDARGQALPPGQSGRLLVTLLDNRRFPLIRYDIGDVAALSADAPCSCGSSFPRLDRIEGRASEVLARPDGGVVSPVAICHIVGVVHDRGAIRRYQLAQESGTRFVLRLEWDDDASDAERARTESAICRDMGILLGPGSELSVERVERIEPTPSGKFLCTIDRRPRVR